jgi:hypothetical protein
VKEDRAMATVMKIRWDGISEANYDEARDPVGWEKRTPEGAIFHVAWFTDGGINLIDVWDDQHAFDTFAEQRLMPVVKGELGFAGEPRVEFFGAHRFFDALSGDVGS